MDLGKLTDEQKKGLGEPNARFLTAKEKSALWKILGSVKVITIKQTRSHAKQN